MFVQSSSLFTVFTTSLRQAARYCTTISSRARARLSLVGVWKKQFTLLQLDDVSFQRDLVVHMDYLELSVRRCSYLVTLGNMNV